VLPKPHIVIFGKSHIAMALCRISQAMDYRVSLVDQEIDQEMFPGAEDYFLLDAFTAEQTDPTSHLIVCTQGYGDEAALYQAIQMGADYIAFVSSRKKAQSIFTDLRKKGITIDQLKKIKTPAGLDIHAKRPEEVAISILAEIIKELRSGNQLSDKSAKSKDLKEVVLTNNDFYINPVCNIPVQKSTAKHVINHQGTNVYFCCDGCKYKFEEEPEKYIPSEVK
jgi:xanthine dehydrogenase accessory factor